MERKLAECHNCNIEWPTRYMLTSENMGVTTRHHIYSEMT